MQYCLVITTTPNQQEAKTLAKSILEAKLSACVQLSNISSYYVWDNKVTNDDEVRLLIKTKKSLYEKLQTHIIQNHSYDTPEIIMLNIDDGSQKYLDWIEEVTI